ncbi:MAG TPA: hypothetical protein V6D47_14885 [Oscillatoriaceae cyanobacterium]
MATKAKRPSNKGFQGAEPVMNAGPDSAERMGGVIDATERSLGNFKAVSTIREDSRGRVTLTGSGRPHKPDAYKQYVNEFGEILLIPIKEIPERELWLWRNTAAMASVQRGLEQSASGKTTRLDLSTLPPDDEN